LPGRIVLTLLLPALMRTRVALLSTSSFPNKNLIGIHLDRFAIPNSR